MLAMDLPSCDKYRSGRGTEASRMHPLLAKFVHEEVEIMAAEVAAILTCILISLLSATLQVL